jgi:GntR family transcriptional regulator
MIDNAREQKASVPSVGDRSAFAFSEATPIYVRLILLFRRNIETGIWPVGEKIPVLNSLAEEFGVSRATVRQAMSFLENEGLVSGTRGRGTFVIAKPQHQPWLDLEESWEDLHRQSLDVEADWVEISKPMWEPDLSDLTTGTQVDSYHVLRRVLSQNKVPYLIGTSYVDQRIVDKVGEQIFRTNALFDILKPYVAQVDQSVTVDMADAETAYLIQIPLNSPTVVLRRACVNRDGEVIYQGEGILRGDFVRIERQIS